MMTKLIGTTKGWMAVHYNLGGVAMRKMRTTRVVGWKMVHKPDNRPVLLATKHFGVEPLTGRLPEFGKLTRLAAKWRAGGMACDVAPIVEVVK